MTTVAAPEFLVTGGVDTHLDLHVAAALNHLGGVLATASFPTTTAGYRKLLAWLRSFGTVGRVGVEGTGSYGAALARHLTIEGVEVSEVSRPNRQVRRRHGKTDVVDAIAAARAVMSGEASATPKTHDGAVESLRMLKLLQRSANKARTQALNQLRSTLVTAPPELRARLQPLPRPELLSTCAAFRVADKDDSVTGITRLTLRDLAQRVRFLDERLDLVVERLRRITTATAPALVGLHGVGPDTASTLLLAAGENPERLANERPAGHAESCAYRICVLSAETTP
jgi:transposase